MTLLTAYNKDVQRYFQGGYCNKIRKETIISAIEEKVFSLGQSFSKLFPNKKKIVLDEIIYLLSGTGLCKIGAEKLAEKAGCSVRTVKGAVASIKQTNQILVARLADDKAGKYIFVYKEHPNFKQILNEVFFIDSLPESDEIAQPFAPLQNAESIGAVSTKGQKSSSNHINSFIKQEKDIIQATIETDIRTSSTKTIAEQREQLLEYKANSHQLWLFDMLQDLAGPVKEVAGILALRLGPDADEHKAWKGFKLACKIANNVMDREKGGKPIESVPAVFSDGLKRARV